MLRNIEGVTKGLKAPVTRLKAGDKQNKALTKENDNMFFRHFIMPNIRDAAAAKADGS